MMHVSHVNIYSRLAYCTVARDHMRAFEFITVNALYQNYLLNLFSAAAVTQLLDTGQGTGLRIHTR